MLFLLVQPAVTVTTSLGNQAGLAKWAEAENYLGILRKLNSWNIYFLGGSGAGSGSTLLKYNVVI